MKKLLILLNVLLLNTLCVGATSNVTIKMRLTPEINTTEQTVYVYRIDGNEFIIYDSVQTVPSQSEYTLKCNIDEADVVRLLFSKRGPMMAEFLVHPDEEVEVLIEEDDDKLHGINKRLIRGSKENDYWVDFWNVISKISDERMGYERILNTPNLTDAEKETAQSKIDSCNQEHTKFFLKELEQPYSPYIADLSRTLVRNDIPQEDYMALLSKCHELYPDYRRITRAYEIANGRYKYPPASEESRKNMRIIKTTERGRITLRNTASPTDTLKVGEQVCMNLVDSLGHEIPLSKYQGKFVLLDFWASWCVPCRQALPEILYVQKTYADRLVVCAINIDKDEAAWKRAVREWGMEPFAHFKGTDGEGNIREDTKRLIAKGTIPQNYLLDRSGKIVGINVYGEELTKLLEENTKQ